MKGVIGLLMILVGIVLGFYVGLWVCFIGGIVGVIEEIKADELSALRVAVSVAKIMFAGFFGWLSGVILVLPGLVVMKNS